MTYEVYVDDNFHYMDQSRRSAHGKYASLDEAIKVCQQIVDDYLLSEQTPGMSAEELYSSYREFGDDPFIIGGTPNVRGVLFSAWDYAKHRCNELCAVSKADLG